MGKVTSKFNIKYSHVKKLLLLLAFIYAFFSCLFFFNKKDSLSTYEFSSDKLLSTENFSTGTNQLTNQIHLKKGCYYYSVYYYSKGATDSFFYPSTESVVFNVMDNTSIMCKNGINTSEDCFWVNQDTDITINIDYRGNGEIEIYELSLRETSSVLMRTLFLNLIICVLIISGTYLYECFEKHPEILDNKIYFWILTGLIVICSFPAFLPHMLCGNDYGFHMYRIRGIVDALKCGQFPVRINPDFYNGYGYANPEYYGELLLFIPAIFHMFGFRLSTAYNFYIIIINLFTVIISYYCFKRIFNNKLLGLFTTYLYVLSPYRIVCIYLRCAIGEYSAMTFFPIILYGLWLIYTFEVDDKKYLFSFIPLTIGLSGIIQTHMLTCEMSALFIVLLCIILFKKTFQPKRFMMLCVSVVTTIFINLWFILPFIDCMINQEVRINSPETKLRMIQSSGLYFSQLFTLMPPYFFTSLQSTDSTGYKDEMPLVLGLSFMFGFILFLGFFKYKGSENPYKKIGLLSFIMFCISIVFTTIYFPWDNLASINKFFNKMVTSLQFPWRFLGLSIFFGSLFITVAIIYLKEKQEKIYLHIVVALCIIHIITPVYIMQDCIQNMYPLVANDVSDVTYSSISSVSGAEYSLIGAAYNMYESINGPIPYGEVYLTDYKKDGTNIYLKIDYTGDNAFIEVPLLAYRGYSVKGDSEEINSSILEAGERKNIRINIPSGYSGTINLYFKGFVLWRIAEVISLLSIVGLIVWYIYYNKKIRQSV